MRWRHVGVALAVLGGCGWTAPSAGQREPVPGELVGRLAHEPIEESSGWAASRRSPGVFWTLNDSGHAPVIYACRRNGELVGEVTLAGATNQDWESLASDDAGRLWVADVGDNRRQRSEVVVYGLPEPEPEPSARGEVACQAYRFRYPDRARDCEAVVVEGDTIYLFSKEFVGPCQVFAGRLSGEHDTIVTLTPVAELNLIGQVTGAELRPGGGALVLTGYDSCHVFVGAGGVVELLGRPPHAFRLPRLTRRVEAVAFDGADLLFTSEERDIMRVAAATWQAQPTRLVTEEE